MTAKGTAETFRSDRGLGVVELMLVAVLTGIVITAGYTVLTAGHRIADDAEASSVANDEVRMATGQMSMELRQAQELADGYGAFKTAEARRCVFYADIDHDSLPERVTYSVSGRRIIRTAAEALAQPVTPSTTWGSESTPIPLVTDLSPTWSGPIFTYLTAGSTPATLSGSPTDIPKISVVQLQTVIAVTSGDVTSVVDGSTSVKVRSVQNMIQ